MPAALAIYFVFRRQAQGTAFCAFFFFEQCLPTARYMADARALVLPLVTTGDPEFAKHDFNAIFSSLGVLNYDTKIAAVVRLLGWCGMTAVVIWFARQKTGRKLSSPIHAPDEEASRLQQFLTGESKRR